MTQVEPFAHNTRQHGRCRVSYRWVLSVASALSIESAPYYQHRVASSHSLPTAITPPQAAALWLAARFGQHGNTEDFISGYSIQTTSTQTLAGITSNQAAHFYGYRLPRTSALSQNTRQTAAIRDFAWLLFAAKLSHNGYFPPISQLFRCLSWANLYTVAAN